MHNTKKSFWPPISLKIAIKQMQWATHKKHIISKRKIYLRVQPNSIAKTCHPFIATMVYSSGSIL